MNELNTLENNYFPNISLPNFDRDALQVSFDASYTSPVMNQDQGDSKDPMCEVPQGEQSVPVLDNTNMVALPTTVPPVMMQDPPVTSSLPSLPGDSVFCQSVLTYPNCYNEVFISPNLIVLQRKEPEGGQESLNSELLTFFRSCQLSASKPFLNQVANQHVPRPYSSLPPLLPKPTLYPIITPIINDPNCLPPPVFSSFACSGNNTNPTPNLMYDPASTLTNIPTPMNCSTLPPPFANSLPTTMDTTTPTNTINPINPIINPTNTTNTTNNSPCRKANARASPKSGRKPAKANAKSGNTTKRGSRPFSCFVRQMLVNWMTDHKSHPYCSREEKIELAKLTGLEVKQITMWMINSRRRNNFSNLRV